MSGGVINFILRCVKKGSGGNARNARFADGGRDWTRTSDPYRVKVVL